MTVCGSLPVSDEVVKQNISHSGGLGLPTYREFKPTAKHLAVIGGGPSIQERMKQILEWEGDIWAINGAWQWLKRLGRESIFLGVDPHPILLDWIPGVNVALIESRVDPEVFRRLKDAKVYTFDLGDQPGQVRSGSSAATATPHLACRIGYHSVTLFGCESSYQPLSSHAYQHENRPEEMIVRCGKGEYLTAPDFYMQALELARYMKDALVPGYPPYIREESGGLLRAMIQNDSEHSILWVSDGMAAGLKPQKPQEQPA